MSGNELPKVIDKSQADIDAAIDAIRVSNIPAGTKDFAISCIKLAVWLPKALLEHKIKLSNLRKLIFGLGRRNKKKSSHDTGQSDAKNEMKDGDNLNSVEKSLPVSTETVEATNQTSAPGHGRLPHSAYVNTVDHQLSIPVLRSGDLCPAECGGKLYHIEPGILVRVKGQNLAAVHKYWIEKLRCALCGHLVSADIPDEVGNQKYDTTFKALLALQKYYVAIPFYRQAYFQSLLGVPLPASTQWQLVEEVGGALFYNGTSHAGENMERLLNKRDTHSGTVIQMCDALSCNLPASFKTILCNCLSHGFRKFDDLKDFYPAQCIHVIDLIAKVYEFDEKIREMTKLERLAYHQEHSEPIMDQLRGYLLNLLESKQVEPNDSLGKSIKYMLKHWHELTQFLRVAGAPLDNNIVERSLKIPIRGRRTWLFYKTEYGAMIGGVLTSIIYTCVLSGVNPLNYQIALQEHKNQIVKEPECWLPWNYQDTLTTLSLAA